MKIVTFRVPCRVYRDGGAILMQTFEEKRTQLREVSVSVDATDIPSKAKEISDQNDSNMTIAKSVLFRNQQETETSVELSYLME